MLSTKPASGGGGSFLAEQNFANGSGATPGAPVSGGSWSVESGTWVFNNTSPALPNGGNNAKGAADFGGGVTSWTYTSGARRFGYFQFQTPTAVPSSNKKLYVFRSGATEVCWVSQLTDGTIAVFNNNFEGYATVSTVSANTNYQIWVEYNGTGGSMNVGFATSGTRPTSGSNYASGSNSVSTAVDTGAIRYGDENYLTYFDRVLTNDTQIGDSP